MSQTPPDAAPGAAAAPPGDPGDLPQDPGAGPPARSDGRHRLAWMAATAFAVAVFGAWVWAIFIYDPGLLVDELADRSFPEAAEPICADAMAQLDELPRAESTDDPVERAAVIDRADALLTGMVGRLRPLAPTSPPAAAEAVNEWLGDWEVHIVDRARYAAALRDDADARFTESVKGSKQLSRAVDGFAQVNRMNSCETPGDVG